MKTLPKLIIVDASILFSFFKASSERRRVIEELPNMGCRLICPKFTFRELLKEEEKIKKFAKIDDIAFAFLFSLLELKIDSIKEEEYENFSLEANKISPHKDDTKDDPYFALSLLFNKAPIWSDEVAFKQQSEIEVFSTKELIELLEKDSKSAEVLEEDEE